MPRALTHGGRPFYFLNKSAVKKVKKVVSAAKLEPEKREETDADVAGRHKNEFFRDSDPGYYSSSHHKSDCQTCCLGGVFTMEAGLISINKLLLSVIGQPRGNLATSHTPITQEFKISDNGKVVECVKKATGQKFALKVLKDNAKSRREIDLHWRASSCKHIVNIEAVFENTYNNHKCLLVVMEM